MVWGWSRHNKSSDKTGHPLMQSVRSGRQATSRVTHLHELRQQQQAAAGKVGGSLLGHLQATQST
mgnify:CR=1 FL=1